MTRATHEVRTPVLRPVRVLDGDAPLTGLFVIFQVDPADPLHAAVSSAYRDAWDDETGAGEPLRYALGFVDADGFLRPVRGAQGGSPCNPWRELFPDGAMHRSSRKSGPAVPRLNPHVWRLSGEASVRVLLIRHPSPDRARAVLRALCDPAQGSSQYHLPEDFAPLMQSCTVTSSGGYLVLDLSRFGAGAYWPPGPARYGGWTLYADMPHAGRPELGDHVKQLREDLGALLYAFRGGSPYSDPPNADRKVTGAFDGGVFAAVAGFHRDLTAGRAFHLADAQDARGSMQASYAAEWGQLEPAWRFLLGAPAEAPPPPPPPTLACFEEDERWEPGVVDRRTAEAIERWLDAGCVRPFRDPQVYGAGEGALHDPILVPLVARQVGRDGNWFEWAIPDLVVRVTVLRFLLLRLGCPYGMSLSHTFREIASPGGAGKALCSIHKTGRAVDFATVGSVTRSDKVVDYAHPIGAWPVRYEGDWFGGDAARAHTDKLLQDAVHKRDKKAAELGQTDDKLAGLRGSAGDHPTPAQQGQIKKLEAQRAKLATEHEELVKCATYAQEDRDRAYDDRDPGKVGQRLRWRLFAHTTWLPPVGRDGYLALAERIGLPAAVQSIDELDCDAATSLEAEVLAFFARQLGNSPEAQRWLEGPRRLVRSVVRELFGRGSSGRARLSELVDLQDARYGLFRTTIRPWEYHPLGDSAGWPGAAIKASDETTASRLYLDAGRREPAAVPAHTVAFVNATRLAQICGLHRIGPQMAHIRDPSSVTHDGEQEPAPVAMAVVEPAGKTAAPDTRPPGAITGLCRKLAAETRYQDREIKIVRSEQASFKVALAELDIDTMGRWVLANKVGNKNQHQPHQPHGYAIRVELPPRSDGAAPAPSAASTASKASKASQASMDAKRRAVADAQRRVLVQLFRAFAQLPFYVIAGPGALAGLPGDVAKGPRTGGEWASLFAEHGPTPTAGASTAKQRTDWSIELQPCFLKQLPKDGLSGVPFLPEDVVELPAPGVGRALEWWHHETAEANRRTWGELLVSVGYGREALIAPKIPPPEDRPFAINGRGLGFVPTKGTTPDVVRGGATRSEVDGHPVENGT